MKSVKIADTTREERIRIVQEALSWGDECGGGSIDACSIDRFYEPYIEGELELAELNMRKAADAYERGDGGREGRGGCSWA